VEGKVSVTTGASPSLTALEFATDALNVTVPGVPTLREPLSVLVRARVGAVLRLEAVKRLMAWYSLSPPVEDAQPKANSLGRPAELSQPDCTSTGLVGSAPSMECQTVPAASETSGSVAKR
jgi:hypothetical protein